LKSEFKIIPFVSNNVQFYLIYIRSSKDSTQSLKIWTQYQSKCAHTIALCVHFQTFYYIKLEVKFVTSWQNCSSHCWQKLGLL